jgi:hypothetical protein
MAVLRKRNITIVLANNKRVFHALNDICSVGGGLVSAVVANWLYQHLQVFKITLGCCYLSSIPEFRVLF